MPGSSIGHDRQAVHVMGLKARQQSARMKDFRRRQQGSILSGEIIFDQRRDPLNRECRWKQRRISLTGMCAAPWQRWIETLIDVAAHSANENCRTIRTLRSFFAEGAQQF
jgi:hypothetical protein